MAGEAFSGKSGTVKHGSGTPADLTEVTKWSLERSVAVPKYNSNTTGGHKRGVSAVADTKGTIEVKVGDTAGAELQPGDVVELQLHVDDSDSNYYQIDEAIISESPIEVDIDGGEVVGMTYSFEASDCTPNGIVA